MNCPRCQTDIDQHPSGPCLDAWVAEVVMGYTKTRCVLGAHEYFKWISPDGEIGCAGLPRFSTTGDGMLEVMERTKTMWLITDGENGSFAVVAGKGADLFRDRSFALTPPSPCAGRRSRLSREVKNEQ